MQNRQVYKNLKDLYEKNPEAYKQLRKVNNEQKCYGSMSDYYKENHLMPIYLKDEEKNFCGIVGSVGTRLKGTVLKVSKDKVLMGFNDGQNGILERNDFAWTYIESLRNFCNVGDELRVVVIDNDGSELILSRKVLYENPWLSFKDRYKVGDKIRVTIKAIKKTKLIVTFEESCIKELDPYTVYVGEITFKKSIRRRLRTDLTEGLSINAKILIIDIEKETLILQSDEI